MFAMKNPKVCIVYNSKKNKNSYKIVKALSQRIDCDCFYVGQKHNLKKYSLIIIVAASVGDEEIPQPMEDYLCSINLENKNYSICILGNYFGFKNYEGCGKIIKNILNNKNWKIQSESYIDSFPELDIPNDFYINFTNLFNSAS